MASLVGTPQTTDYGFSADRDAVNIPAGLSAGNIIFFVLTTANAHSIAGTPAGVAQIGSTQDAPSADSSTSVLWYEATGSEGSTFDLGTIFSAAESGGALAFAYSGLDASDLVEAVDSDAQAAVTVVSGPSITPTNDNCLILQIFGHDPGAAANTFTADASPVATKVFDGKVDTGNWGQVGAQSYEQATAAAIALDATYDFARDVAAFQIALNQVSVSGPSLDTVPSTAYPGQTITITGTGLTGASADYGGETASVTVNSDIEIEVTISQGDLPYDTHTLTITTGGGSDTADVELVADTASRFGFVVMVDPNTTDESSVAYNTTPTVVNPDQFEWEDFNDLAGESDPAIPLEIDSSGFVVAVGGEGVFRGRFWDASDSTWGTVEDFSAEVDSVDETAPTIESASVPTAGDNIAVQMDEPMQIGAGGSGGWTISLVGVSVSSAAVDGSDDTIINLTPSRTLTDEDTLTIGYTQPGDGFQDQADTPNDLATLSGQAVTNNSTQEPPDVTGPVTQSVTVPTDGTYAIGDDLSFTVNWDEAVTVTGTPALNLDIGGTTRQANYASGSGTAALVFEYDVAGGDEDADGIEVSSLTLEGGTLRDAEDNDANLSLNGVGDTSGVLVDGVAPIISINPLTTTDTTPVVTGSAGDATSLTLVVNSVTYNPTPSGGSWSQQLPELALDTYPMTLNGEDAAGNGAVEAQANLIITDSLPIMRGRPGFNIKLGIGF